MILNGPESTDTPQLLITEEITTSVEASVASVETQSQAMELSVTSELITLKPKMIKEEATDINWELAPDLKPPVVQDLDKTSIMKLSPLPMGSTSLLAHVFEQLIYHPIL